jgi:hypothetical protein
MNARYENAQEANHAVVCCILDMVFVCVRAGAELHNTTGGAKEQSPAIIV